MDEIEKAEMRLLRRKCDQLEERLQKLETAGNKEFATPKEVADMLACSQNNIYIKIRQGKIKAVLLGRSYRIPLGQFQTQSPAEAMRHKIFG